MKQPLALRLALRFFRGFVILLSGGILAGAILLHMANSEPRTWIIEQQDMTLE